MYARAENSNNCFGIGNLDLVVNSLPVAIDLNDYIICSDSPNVSSIDLTQFDDDVLNGQDPANFSVSYYENETDANTNLIF